MRAFPPHLTLACILGLAPLQVFAQNTTNPLPTGAQTLSEAEQPGRNERIQRIHHEDAGSRIDELRVGGQTQRITVQTPTDVPAYEVIPANDHRSASGGIGGTMDRSGGNAGQRVWNVLKF